MLQTGMPQAREVFDLERDGARARDGDSAASADCRQCRICLQNGGDDLIKPCCCDGTSRWVHRDCLNHWRVSATNRRAFTHCQECGAGYVLALHRSADVGSPEEEVAKRRRQFLRQTVKHFVLVLLGSQFVLCTLAMLVRLIDQHESLVTIFNLPQRQECPEVGTSDFLDALRCHKATYYLSAVLFVLFVIGVVTAVCGLVVMLRELCGGRVRCGQCDGPCRRCPYYLNFTPVDCSCCADCCRFEAGSLAAADSLGACAIIVAISFILLGLVFAIMAFVAWTQMTVKRYLQMKELRFLTGEYIVQDLSEVACPMPAPSAPAQHDMCASPSPSWAPVTDHATEQSLVRDMQAVYGADFGVTSPR